MSWGQRLIVRAVGLGMLLIAFFSGMALPFAVLMGVLAMLLVMMS
jgi:hypothetical protein